MELFLQRSQRRDARLLASKLGITLAVLVVVAIAAFYSPPVYRASYILSPFDLRGLRASEIKSELFLDLMLREPQVAALLRQNADPPAHLRQNLSTRGFIIRTFGSTTQTQHCVQITYSSPREAEAEAIADVALDVFFRLHPPTLDEKTQRKLDELEERRAELAEILARLREREVDSAAIEATDRAFMRVSRELLKARTESAGPRPHFQMQPPIKPPSQVIAPLAALTAFSLPHLTLVLVQYLRRQGHSRWQFGLYELLTLTLVVSVLIGWGIVFQRFPDWVG